jgi:hypothetical protein
MRRRDELPILCSIKWCDGGSFLRRNESRCARCHAKWSCNCSMTRGCVLGTNPCGQIEFGLHSKRMAWHSRGKGIILTSNSNPMCNITRRPRFEVRCNPVLGSHSRERLPFKPSSATPLIMQQREPRGRRGNSSKFPPESQQLC